MEKGAQKIHIQQQKFTKSKHLGPGVEGESRHEINEVLAFALFSKLCCQFLKADTFSKKLRGVSLTVKSEACCCDGGFEAWSKYLMHFPQIYVVQGCGKM